MVNTEQVEYSSSSDMEQLQQQQQSDEEYGVPPILIVVNAHYDLLTDNTRQRLMPWDGYQRASLISAEENTSLARFETALKQLADPAECSLQLEPPMEDSLFDEDDGIAESSSASVAVGNASTRSRINTLTSSYHSDIRPSATAAAAAAAANSGPFYTRSELYGFLGVFAAILSRLTRVDALQYIAVRVDDLLCTNPSLLETESDEERTVIVSLSDGLARCLQRDDDFLGIKVAKVLSLIHLAAVAQAPSTSSSSANQQPSQSQSESQSFSLLQPPPALLRWLIARVDPATSPNTLDVVVQLLQSLLSSSACRVQFYASPNGVSSLAALLKSGASSQMQYQITYCFWLLSFEPAAASTILRRYELTPLLLDIARASIKEKVIRVIIGTFRNIYARTVVTPAQNAASGPASSQGTVSTESEHPFVPDALMTSRLLSFCETLLFRKWTDPDLFTDLEQLTQELKEVVQRLTTFDEYLSELDRGRLEWSPSHKSDAFWKVNVVHFSENRGELVRRLYSLINTSTDSVSLAVALNDMGMIIKHLENGKKLVQDAGAKQRIMELMSHADPDVRYNALITVQKLMTHAWQ
ncbi:ARM repeat-containing protein [Ramicandelaber brevisporus]|nr:ARM repeat-containing protein [Ramicandelaber brevisporus]